MADRRAALAAAAALLLTVTATGAAPASDPAGAGSVATDTSGARLARQVWVTFEQPTYTSGSPITEVRNEGVAATAVNLVTRDGGSAIAAAGFRSDLAARLPEYATGAAPPRAVIAVTSEGTSDRLDPGTGDFVFGADFRMDSATDGAGADNGDNLVQRGLYEDRAQFKIQLDHHLPTCRVKGSAGVVQVSTGVPVTAGAWYRVRCRRSGTTVQLTVQRLGTETTNRATRSGATGAMTPSSPRVPLSVGGKLNGYGSLVPSTDQFNGVVDDVVLRFG